MSVSEWDCGNIANLRFNQDHGCFSCAMDSGLRIYNVEPLQENAHLDTSIVGSVSVCEMLYRTNLLAIVGGGKQQKFAENAVLLWDDGDRKFVSEFTFSSQVLSLRLQRERLFVTQKHKIHVFRFHKDPKKLFSFDTGDNPKGLCEVSPFPRSERQLLVFPGHYSGTIQIVDLDEISPGSCAAPVTINAHKSDIACIAINQEGTHVATASCKGTLIRVYSTYSKELMVELRRGLDAASLYCINFSSDSDFLCASSDKGTIHIFALKDQHRNKRYALSKAAKLVGSYGESQYSFATFRVSEECKCICAFGANSSIYAICVDGTFHKYVYSNDGKCKRESYDRYLSLCPDGNF